MKDSICSINYPSNSFTSNNLSFLILSNKETGVKFESTNLRSVLRLLFLNSVLKNFSQMYSLSQCLKIST